MRSALLKWIAATAALIGLSMPLAPSAQQKTPEHAPVPDSGPFKLSVGTNMVLVPVVVNDKQGNHVSALTASDFEIREDGNVKKIVGFEEITAESTVVQRAPVDANTFTNQFAAAHPKNLEIILLDLLNTPFAGRAEARRGLIKFLSNSTDADTLVALLVLRSNGVRMIHNFTSDPSVLVAAIHKLQDRATSRDAPAMNTNGGDVDAEASQLSAIFAGIAASQHAVTTVAQAKTISRGLEALSDSSQQSQESLNTLESMQQIARYFAAVPGRKSLIWASTGFRFSLGNLSGEATRGATPADWQRSMRMLQDANIAVYPVDLAGVGLGGGGDAAIHGQIPDGAQGSALEALGLGRLTDPTFGKHETMKTVADMTGGQAYYNANDTAELFRRARQDSAQYYMLAYYTDPGKDGWRKLNVQVHHEGVQVHARIGFFFYNATPDPDSTRQADEIMAVTSALESTSLPFKGQWQLIESDGIKRKVHFQLSIPPGAATIDAEHENHLFLDFLVLAWNADGKEAARVTQRLDRKLSQADVDQIRSRGITYLNSLTLEPGEYNVHIVVRDNLKGNLGSVATQLKVDE